MSLHLRLLKTTSKSTSTSSKGLVIGKFIQWGIEHLTLNNFLKLELKTHTHTHTRVRTKEAPCASCTWAFLSFTYKIFPHQVFSPFWREIFLVGPPTFSSLPSQPNILQKNFPSHFFFFSFSLKSTQPNTPLVTSSSSFSNATSTKVQAILVLLPHGASKAY